VRSIGTVSSGVVQESPTVSTCEVPERRVRIPSTASQKGERSIGTVSSGVVQESPTVSTCEVPERRPPEPRVPKATLRPAAQPAPPGAVRKIALAANQPPHHDSHATQSEPHGNVPDNTQEGEARVERSFILGVEAK